MCRSKATVGSDGSLFVTMIVVTIIPIYASPYSVDSIISPIFLTVSLC